METHEIVEHAVQEAPIVHRLLSTGKVAGAALAIGALVGGAGGAIGMSLRGPKQDIADANTRIAANVLGITTLRREFDSVVVELHELKTDIKTTTNLACISARARNPEVARAAGCDGRELNQ